VLIAIVAVLPFTRDAIANSWHRTQFESAVVNLPHPANTRPIDSQSRVGLLHGNGNHCDFFAGQLRSFEGDFEDIQAHYESVTFRNPVYDRDESVEVQLVQPGDLPYDDIVTWNVSANDGESIFLVSIYRNYEANADFRCH